MSNTTTKLMRKEFNARINYATVYSLAEMKKIITEIYKSIHGAKLKKAPSPYNLFVKERMPIVSAHNKSLPEDERVLSKGFMALIAAEWNALTDEEKKGYIKHEEIMKPEYKLRDWVLKKIGIKDLYYNHPGAIDIIKQKENWNKIDWERLSESKYFNEDAIELLRKRRDEEHNMTKKEYKKQGANVIQWYYLSENPLAIDLLRRRIDEEKLRKNTMNMMIRMVTSS